MATDSINRVSAMDESHLVLLRNHVTELFREAGRFASGIENCQILDVAPQDHGGVQPYLTGNTHLKTIDINPDSGADIIADICEFNEGIADSSFDVVVCTEVLEHVSNPFWAASEIFRILKPGGVAYFSAPFNFRIHGPLPDNWRFSEHGWRNLLSPYGSVDIDVLETPERFLMPIHYNITAVK